MRIFVLFVLTSFLANGSTAIAEYLDPEVKTQVNEQTSFFKDSVENMAEVEKEIKASISNTEKAHEDVIGLSNMMESLAGGSKGTEIQKTKNDLSGISADDLADKGRSKMMEENLLEQLYPDEDAPLMKQHKKDVDFLVDNHKKLFGNLLEVLKQHGLHINCKQVKGSKVVEPGYVLEVEKKVEQELEYEQKTCEELRNRYRCRDVLKVECTNKEPVYGDWQVRHIRLNGWDIYQNHRHWLYPVFWKKGRHGLHMKGDDFTKQQVAQKIADKIDRNVGDIIMHPISPRGLEPTLYGELTYDEYVAFALYSFTYSIKPLKGYKCTNWLQTWVETCRLK